MCAYLIKSIARYSDGLISVNVKTLLPHDKTKIFLTGMHPQKYRYWRNRHDRTLDYYNILEDISNIPESAIIVLHACCHYPTATDPTETQWTEILDACRKRDLFPFFDMTFQGLASGDPEKDAFPVRQALQKFGLVAVAQSFSYNMGLYGDRIGLFHIATTGPKEAARILSQMKVFFLPSLRSTWIVSEVLSQKRLKQIWLNDVQMIANKNASLRALLKMELAKAGSIRKWDHIVEQKGPICYTTLTPCQCQEMRKKYSIFLPDNGTVSIASLGTCYVPYLAHAMHNVTKYTFW